jgi:MraZ protein
VLIWWSFVEKSGNAWRCSASVSGYLVFLGSFEHTLDEKGRVSLPIKFREILSAKGDTRLVLTGNVDPGGSCLVAYPIQEWQAFQDRIAALPQFDEAVIRLKRLHIAGASEILPDKQGRILIPPLLREYAGLEGPVVFAGLGANIEIWDRARWEEARRSAKASLAEINDSLARLGL